MNRFLVILASRFQRTLAADMLAKCPEGWRVTFQAPQRTLEQNSLLHAIITEVSVQVGHNGRRISPERWKRLFMDALKSELDCERSLDGQRMVPISRSSADLSKAELSDLVEVIYAWGASHGVQFSSKDAEEPNKPSAVAA